ncbi:hypothetical protein QT196_38890 (plasmid) [Streptomyces sp. P9-2B-2]|uniref:hypothetical protein n=1 Tax=Streptomyces sp. P9-2B-2 TaxID=3057114 RepID=UPI0025B32690|nr:hypothetical protein [Streptomyces sp. P9-2B-2]WJY43231.1 hypothetical protein QT196_38890 [Streptomyces sp. P9-2B-2]
MSTSMASTITRPRSGLREVIKRTERDDDRGYERDETDAYQCLAAWKADRAKATDALARLHTEVQHRRRTADARIPDSRRAPRTLDSMRDRLPLPLSPVAATEEDLNRELDNPAEDWDQAVPRTVLPQAAGDEHLGGGSLETSRSVTSEVTCPFCSESNEEGSACKRCGR